MEPILEIADRHGVMVIEDAAEMHGQTCRDHPCGSFGLISTFSFYPNKHVTCGEGGMVVTDDDEIADRCRRFRNLCFEPPRRFVHRDLGWNYRMTNMQAALGLAQLERLRQHVARKRDIGRLYQQQLAGLSGIQLPRASMSYADNIYWVFGIVCHQELPISAREVARLLGQQQIGTRPFFWPMHQQPVFQDMGLFQGQTFPVAERLAERGIYLPCGLGLTDEDIGVVCDALRKIIQTR
jgi:perosamine synthetase